MKLTVITLLLLCLSTSLMAKEYSKEDFQKLMKSYLSALQQKDEKVLSRIMSERLLKKFKDNGQMKQVFIAQKEKSVGKFDLTFKKALVENDLYMVNIKNPEDKEYGEYWYLVKEVKGKLILDEMQNLK